MDSSRSKASEIAGNAGLVSLAVMASRLLGLVRDQVFAIFFGAGLHYDAFLTAFRVPNLLRDLFAEGALSSAFVTVFSQRLATRGDAEAIRLSNRVATLATIVIGAISIVAWFFTPQLVRALAPGFFEIPGKAELTVRLTRIMIPFLMLVAWSAQAMGVLNAKNVFGIPALASAFFNIGSIAGGLLLGFSLGPVLGLAPIEGMAFGTLVGGFLQFAVQWPSLVRVGFSYRPMLAWADPGVRQVLRLMGPAVLGTAAVQINVFVNTNFASAIIDPQTGAVANGPVSWLNYAFRFMQLPIGVFGVAVATAALPPLSRLAVRQDPAEFRATLAHALGLVFLWCIPSAVGLAVLGRPIIALIFEHGRFTAFDTAQTANALAAYSAGLAGYAAIKVLSPAFYALQDARTPMIVSLISIAINYGLNSLLVQPFGHVGLAFSTSGVALANFLMLALLMRRRIGGLEGRRLAASVARIAAASAAMAGAAWGASALCAGLPLRGIALRLAQVGVAVPLGAAVFYAAGRCLGVEELRDSAAAARRWLARAGVRL
ncbi:MAG TPA: murein biosynthesis integral membrane protein MurJ [candidate division Zixibacteria bacterium]|nr:murein biosynthesis integral membrane protein MurJ [candidate division Zixibacteria bacterium]